MKNHKARGNGDRSFQSGKGDADRSPRWREHYDEINWPDGGKLKLGGKFVKKYGATAPRTLEDIMKET